MIYALFGLFFVITCLLAFLSAKSWNWLHITALFLNGLLVMFALVLVANYMDWQRKWRVAYDRNLADLQEARAVGRTLKYGDPMKDVQEEPTFIELTGRFNRLVYQRGRVWRRCSRRNVQNNQFQIQVVPDNAPANLVHGIAQGVSLYAFLEQVPFAAAGADQAAGGMQGQGDQPPFLLPGAYLGEFTVTATDAKTVTLRPSAPLDPYQQQHVRAGATWVLYEVMPVDGHYVFATDESRDIVEYVEPNDDPEQRIFGPMDPQALTRLFDTAVSVNYPRAAGSWRQKVVQELTALYSEDGKSLTLQEAEGKDPEEIWYKVEFLRSYEYRVAPDKEVSFSDTRESFNTDGLAIDPRLVRGDSGKVTFKKGQYGIFKKGLEDRDDNDREYVDDDLDDWIEQGICKIVAPVFVRRLNNYRDGFQLIANETQRVQEAIRQVTANTAQWQEAKRHCDSQITYRRDEKMKLDGEGLPEGQIGELAGFRRDVEATDKLLQELTRQKTSLLEELSRLYRANAALREQLAAVQRYLKEQIDQQTEAAVTLR